MESTVRHRTKPKSRSSPGKTASDGTPSAVARGTPSTAQQMPKTRPLILLVPLCLVLVVLLFRARRQEPASAPSPFAGLGKDKVDFSADSEKQQAIVASFKHAWNAYRRDAWGFDEYHPIARKGNNLSQDGGIGYTIVDALDTMHIMGLMDEFNDARNWIAERLDFERRGDLNAFEVTIRVLGGLLSAYHLSADKVFLDKALDLGERILPIFDTKSGIPLSHIDLAERKATPDMDNRGWSSTAEAATLQLEFKYLSYLTDDYVYWKAAEKAMDAIRAAGSDLGLVPIFIRPEDGSFMTSELRLGSRGDSYYEYLLKQYLQTNREETVYRQMYDRAMEVVQQDLVKYTPANNRLYIAEWVPKRQRQGGVEWVFRAKQDHLVCFLGGSLLLGVTEGQGPFPPRWESLTATQQRDWSTGMQLIDTCVETYNTATGLGPEIAHFKEVGDFDSDTVDWYIKGLDPKRPKSPSFDARYILRPETIESLFLAWRQTGDPKYREQGWKIFQSIEKYCKVEGGGYASVLNVNSTETELEDKMETFFMSETLKYLYLLFSDSSLLPLNEFVFNTEAHPLADIRILNTHITHLLRGPGSLYCYYLSTLLS